MKGNKMIGYKGTTNGKCRSLIYEVGKTYTFNGQIQLCAHGFHFCKNFEDVHNYYAFNDIDTKIFEIEVLGDVLEDGNKSVSNKIKILREIPKTEWSSLCKLIKYEEKDNIIKLSNPTLPNDIWAAFEYDEKGNCIRFEDSDGDLKKYEYDQEGNCIKFEHLNKYWSKTEKGEDQTLQWSITVE